MYKPSTPNQLSHVVLVLLAGFLGGLLGVAATLTAPVAVIGAALAFVVTLTVFIKTRSRAPRVGGARLGGDAGGSAQYLLYLVVVTAVFTSAIPRGSVVPLLAPNEFALLLVLLPAFAFALLSGKERPFPGAPIVAVTLLIAGTVFAPVFSYPLRNMGLTPSQAISYLAPLQYIVLLWLFAVLPKNQAQQKKVVQLIIFCAAIVALIGVLQAFEVPQIAAFLETWYPSDQLPRAAELSRATSVLGAWNALGLFMVVNIFLVLAIYPYETKRLYRVNMQVALVLLPLGLIATNLYSGFLALVFGVFLLRIFDPKILNRQAITVAVIAITLGVAVLLPGLLARYALQSSGGGTFLFETLQYRVNIWVRDFLPLIRENPWWGVSPTFETLPFDFPESQYFYLLIRSGFVGLVAHLGWVVVLLLWLRGVYKRARTPFSSALIAVAITQLLAFSLVGIINPVFTYSGSIDVLWITLGLIVGSERLLAVKTR